MDGLAAQLLRYRGNVVFLEQANRRDPARSHVQAAARVLERNSAQREYWNFILTGLPKCGQIVGGRGGKTSFFEDGSEHCEARAAGGGMGYFGRRVAGNRNQRVLW